MLLTKKKNRAIRNSYSIGKKTKLASHSSVNSIQIGHDSKYDPSSIFSDWINFTTSFSQGIYNKF